MRRLVPRSPREWLRTNRLRRGWPLLLLALLLGGYWLLPISGQVMLIPGDALRAASWPQMHLSPTRPQPGQSATLYVTDVKPWSHVRLTLDGQTVPIDWCAHSGDTWTWEWTLTFPEAESVALVFYRDCRTGCVERGRLIVGEPEMMPPAPRFPTKLGVVMANPVRDWHGRGGWDVELTYARRAEEPYWGVDDLAARVHQAAAQGLRVLVRVDYEQGQSLPPADDYLAMTGYLQYLERLAKDERLRDVYGYFIGSSFNSLGSSRLSPERPVTPEWYARLFNGYGEDVSHTDNVIQTIRAVNPHVRVLVGPLQPWNFDQDGQRGWAIDVPWLDYFNTLVAALDESAQTKAAVGIPLAAPDGFAVQAPGRPGALEMAGREAAEEPRLDLRRAEWGGAQAGFRVYRDWLAIVNAYPSTRGLPVYITSANSFAYDEGTFPAQNYPRGWLTNALQVIDDEPQVQALCWFLDYFPHDTQWEYFSLTRQPGRLIDAAEEFEALLIAND